MLFEHFQHSFGYKIVHLGGRVIYVVREQFGDLCAALGELFPFCLYVAYFRAVLSCHLA